MNAQMHRALVVTLSSLLSAACSSPATTTDGATDRGIDSAIDAATSDTSDTMEAAADATPPWLEPWTVPTRDPFPATFFWGSATSAYQIEGQLHNTDWYQWGQMGKIVNNDSPDTSAHSLTLWQSDIAALTATRQNSYRFGVEWTRLFPTAASWQACRAAATAAGCRAAADPAGLQYYHDLLTGLRAASIIPAMTVQCFVLPTYLNDLSMDYTTQGWMRDAIVDDLERYAGFVANEYGNDVDWWISLNEPTGYGFTAYLGGIHPPGRVFDTDAFKHVSLNMVRAHVRMYDAIHREDTVMATGSRATRPAMVSITHHTRAVMPYNVASARDRASAARADYIVNRWFLEAIIRGNVDTNFDGAIGAGEPSADAAYLNRLDYIGMNYYTTTVMQTNTAIPLLGAVPRPDTEDRGLPKTDFGWDIYPRGLYDMLLVLNGYNLPIIVTENGLPDVTDMNRPRFLAEHLASVAAAIHAGVPVLGYYHWSLIDNLEWASGFCPHFGLHSIDQTSPTRTRVPRPSAMLYANIIQAGQITDAVLNGTAPYANATTYCATQP